MTAFGGSQEWAESKNRVGDKEASSTRGKRKYADEVTIASSGNRSPYAPVEASTASGLGWMLWGICDLQNQHCKLSEAVMEVSCGSSDTANATRQRPKKRRTSNSMGIASHKVLSFLTSNECYTPNMPLVQMAFNRNREQLGVRHAPRASPRRMMKAAARAGRLPRRP